MHCHCLSDSDQAGIYSVVSTVSWDEWDRAVSLEGDERAISLGIHPTFVATLPANWHERLSIRLAQSAAMIGECGLHPHKSRDIRLLQEEVLGWQFSLAHTYNRAMVLHVTGMWDRFFSLLDHYGVPPGGLLMHDFAGSVEVLARLQGYGKILFSYGPSLMKKGFYKKRSLSCNSNGACLF
ncbi:TatD family hydrolase [Chitinivibrio alkaliphilus]|nr:TatD family hydrolase [Chitinivibrio alkaliphilus]